MNETPRKSVTLEDLLRVKRAERPPAEFWDEFERGMRIKQLAAIVEPRPWWAPFIRVGAKFSRYQLPVGAAAIVAVTFVTLREYRTQDLTPAFEPAAAVASVNPTPASSAARSLPAPAVSAPVVSEAALVRDDVPATVAATESAKPEPTQPAVAAAAVGTSSHLVPAAVELTPSDRVFAENLAAARAANPTLDRVLSRSGNLADATTTRVEPLSQVSLPGSTRRSRLLAGAAWFASATSSSDSALRTDDHDSRRLTESRLSESEISRIDVGGNRLTVKF